MRKLELPKFKPKTKARCKETPIVLSFKSSFSKFNHDGGSTIIEQLFAAKSRTN